MVLSTVLLPTEKLSITRLLRLQDVCLLWAFFHFSDEAVKGARRRRGKPQLHQHMRNLDTGQRSPRHTRQDKSTRLRMDPAHEGQQFEHVSLAWSVNTAQLQNMRPPRTRHTQQRHPGVTQILLSHHNSRPSCYTACPSCLTRGPGYSIRDTPCATTPMTPSRLHPQCWLQQCQVPQRYLQTLLVK